MDLQLTFEGVDRSSAVEAAVERWLHRLEAVQPIASCVARVAVDSRWLGLRRHVRVDVEIVTRVGRFAISHGGNFGTRADLYVVISDAFRELLHRLVSHRERGRELDAAPAASARSA